MIELLKAKGYKLTNNDVLNNRQFRLAQTEFVYDEDRSTIAMPFYIKKQTFDLFLDSKYYQDSKIEALLINARADYLLKVEAVVETFETGFIISFTVED